MARRTLITGASGFVGGHLIEHLRAMGDVVMACDRIVPTMQAASHDEPPLSRVATSVDSLDSLDCVLWDLTDASGITPEVRRRIEQFAPEVLCHLAAVSIPADCGIDEPTAEAVAVNVEGTRRVLALAASLPKPPRVLVISSSHVYEPVAAERPVVTEESPLGPVGGYGKTKREAERAALEAANESGLDVVIVRAFQHAGPRQSARLMLAEWARQLARPSPQPIQVRTLDAHIDLTDVRDVVRAYRLLTEHGAASQVYNVGSGESHRSGDLFETLRELADPARPVLELRPGRKQDPIADISRLVECTGWQPEIPIEQTIADTLAYWQAREG